MTPYSVVHKAFLARILEDEWENWLIEEAEADWQEILEAALPWFKFPRVSLEHVIDDGESERGVEVVVHRLLEPADELLRLVSLDLAVFVERGYALDQLVIRLNAVVKALV